jgi:hypothetical protein
MQTLQGRILLNNTYNYIHIQKRFHKDEMQILQGKFC